MIANELGMRPRAFDRTYEGLKQAPVQEGLTKALLLTVPMRV